MSKKMFVVESPNKISKLKKILGSEYIVVASVGHIRGIPAKGMNIDIENGFEPKFEVSRGKGDVVKNLKKIASQVDEIILAMDPDREGEGIAWHIYDVLPKKDQKKCTRVTFTELKPRAVLAALDNKRPINDNLVNAQKARQVLDRLIGYTISPLLWTKVASKTSAGRVQSIALKIVSEREKEISAFKPTDFWYVDADLKAKKGSFKARVITKDKDNKYLDQKLVEKEYKALEKASYVVDKVDKKSKNVSAKHPFDTSSLQTTASTLFNWPIKKTAQISQKLYEQGHCFLPDTLIQLPNGEILTIKEAVDKSTSKLFSTEFIFNRDIGVNAKPLSFDYDGNIRSIKTSTTKIKVTSDHRFPVYDSILGSVVEKFAYELKEGSDFFLHSKESKALNNVKRTSILDVFGKCEESKNILVHFKDGFLKSKIKAKTLTKYNLSDSTRYKYVRQDMLPLDIALDLFDKQTIEDGYHGVKWKSGSSYMMSIPFYVNNETISYLLGVIISDGHLNKNGVFLNSLTLKNPTKIDIDNIVDIRSEINKMFGILGVRPSASLSYKSKLLAVLFRELGVPFGKKSHKVEVPNLLMKWGEACRSSFVSGLFDGDGYFAFNKIKGRNVSIQSGYTSKSYKLISELQVLLSTCGYVSRIHEDKREGVYTLKISIIDVPRFYNYMKESSKIKSRVYEILYRNLDEKIINSNSHNPYNLPINKFLKDKLVEANCNKNSLSKKLNVDLWSFTSKGNSIPSDVNEKVANEIDSDELLYLSRLRFEKVIENVEEKYTGKVYCFQTDNDHFHVADNLITHNCTYIRTDSYNIAKEAIEEVRNLITSDYGDTYLPAKSNFYKKKAKAATQEAHECIRPTDCSFTGSGLNAEQTRLYNLIRDRFIACQMKPMVVDTVTYTVGASTKHKLISKGQAVRFDGWSKVYTHTSTRDVVLPSVVENESLDLNELIKIKGTTKPPPRYNEGSLVKKMEEEGVGRPSTYPSIMENIQKREYVKKKDKKGTLEATELGIRVSDYLDSQFNDFIMDLSYTALLENNLDVIEDGSRSYIDVVKDTYDMMMKKVGEAKGKGAKVVGSTKCTVCKQGNVVEKGGRYGVFYACDRYPECKSIFNLGESNKLILKVAKKIDKSKKCPSCKKAGREGYLQKRNNKKDNSFFFGCNKYPKCKHTESDDVGEAKE